MIQNLESYVKNAVSYILSGLQEGNHVILIENDKIRPLIDEKISGKLPASELKKIKYVNNFDFYWSTGNFHTPTIVAYFSQILEPFLTNSIPVRTWAHVEWGQMQDIADTISKFEEAAHQSVTSMKLLAVCAYDDSRLSPQLKKTLLQSHTHLITDHEIQKL